jgi:oxaloacetate decarboxylase alpha subunit
MTEPKLLGITDVVLRDAHQSLLATRLRIEDMLPIAPKLDRVGYWSLETWGGATLDACIRYLGEDPWERLRSLKPYVAGELVARLKEGRAIPIAMQSHATTGMSTATILKAVEAGIDLVDTAISSMSLTYGHSP